MVGDKGREDQEWERLESGQRGARWEWQGGGQKKIRVGNGGTKARRVHPGREGKKAGGATLNEVKGGGISFFGVELGRVWTECQDRRGLMGVL